MKLCDNCLDTGDPEAVRPIDDVPVGHDFGTQRDPERRTLALCGTCAEALTSGNLELFADRHTNERTIKR